MKKTIKYGIIVFLVSFLAAWISDVVAVDAVWFNDSIMYKRSLTQQNQYPDAFLVGNKLLQINGTLVEIWCDSSAAWLYYNNETGKDIYCVNSSETGIVGTEIINSTFPNTANPWDSSAIIVMHLNGSDCRDSSIYRHTATKGGTPTARTGQIGNGLYFDGLDDNISFGDLNSLDSLSNLTIYAFANTTKAAGSSVVTKRDNVLGTYPFTLRNGAAAEFWNFYVKSAGGEGEAYKTGNINTWYFLTGIYNGNNVLLYYDSIQQFDDATPSGALQDSNGALMIGASLMDAADDMQGMIDEVRIYNMSHNATVINSTYLSAKIGYPFSVMGENITFVEPEINITPINLTDNVEINFCYNDFYLYHKTKDIADNGTAVFNEYLQYCDYGCGNITLMNLGRPGCKSSDLEQFIILIIFVICCIIIFKVVSK